MTYRAVKVYGHPAPKGSLKCIGRRGRQQHALVEDNKGTGQWRDTIRYAGRRLKIPTPWTGPIGIDVTLTLPRPPSVPLRKRAWPIVSRSKGAADVDKLARLILDALQDVHVFGDDAQVVELVARKCYPDTPACPDRLDRPGAVIRLYTIEDIE